MSSLGNSISVAFEIHVESLLSMSSERIPGHEVLTPHVSKKLFLNTILFKSIKGKITRPQELGCTNLEATKHVGMTHLKKKICATLDFLPLPGALNFRLT